MPEVDRLVHFVSQIRTREADPGVPQGQGGAVNVVDLEGHMIQHETRSCQAPSEQIAVGEREDLDLAGFFSSQKGASEGELRAVESSHDAKSEGLCELLDCSLEIQSEIAHMVDRSEHVSSPFRLTKQRFHQSALLFDGPSRKYTDARGRVMAATLTALPRTSCAAIGLELTSGVLAGRLFELTEAGSAQNAPGEMMSRDETAARGADTRAVRGTSLLIAWEHHRARLNRALGVRAMSLAEGGFCVLPERPPESSPGDVPA